jgi:transcriptional regulator with XRE-family HTH domain
MSLISKKFATEMNEKEMRDAYLSAQTRTYVAYQIRTIRAQRGWSQEQFAEKLHTSQSAVSRMEDRQYGKQNLHTLLEVAASFNCGLVVRFVRYADFVKDTSNLSPDHLRVAEFDFDSLIPLVEDRIDRQSATFGVIYPSESVHTGQVTAVVPSQQMPYGMSPTGQTVPSIEPTPSPFFGTQHAQGMRI